MTLDLSKPMRIKSNKSPFECRGDSRRLADHVIGYIGDNKEITTVYIALLENIPETISLNGWYANVYENLVQIYASFDLATLNHRVGCIARHKWPFTEIEIGRFDE